MNRRERGEAVERTARSLMASFEDSTNLKFWYWLIWQLLRGHEPGLGRQRGARVYHDLKYDESINCRAARKPGALVAAELRAAGLLDASRSLAPLRVGTRPSAAA